MSDARNGHRHGLRPDRRGLVALLLATTLATCTSDYPTGPRLAGRGFLAVHPVLVAPASLASFGLTIDSLRVAIIRPPAAIVRDTTVFFNPDSSVLRLLLPVPLQAATETLTVVIELRAGKTVLYSDTSTTRVSVGVTDSSSVAGDTLRYVGPGNTVKHIQITPHDSVVTLSGSQRFRATATDVNGAPVDSFFVSWSSSDAVTAPISKSGLLQAPGKRGRVFVRAVTPTSVYDSTPVTFIPAPFTLAAISGGGQTGGATAKLPLPLRARVTASDTMGVKGIAVRFRATNGGGSVRDSVVLSDSLGFAEDTATLGAAFGAQTFQASVTGLPSVTFGATATGVTIHSADITGDSVWSAALSPHVVTRYLRIVNGGTLTIQTGAVVKFDSGAGLQVGDTSPSVGQGGGLKLDGTGPGITLTANSATPTPGFWKGIEVQRSIAVAPWRRTLIEWGGGTRTAFGTVPAEACVLFVNQSGVEVDLDSVVIRRCVHAGIHHFGGVTHVRRSEIDSVTGSGIHADFDATLQLDSNTVRGSGQEGLLIGSTATHLAPSHFNRFVGNATFGIQMRAAQLPGLLRQDSIAGNATDFIAVNGGQPDPTATAFTIFSQPQRAGSKGYLVQNGLLDVGSVGGQTVTLDSNVVLRFATQSGVVIGDSAGTRSGSIVSLGTNRSNAPRLTSASLSPAPGDWYGLEIGRLSTNTRLANVRVEFAGDSIAGRSRHRFGLLVRSPAAQTLAVDSVVVVSSGRVGSDTNTAGIGVLGSGAGVDIRRSVAQGNLGYGFAFAGVPHVKAVVDTARSNTVGFALFADSGVSVFTPGDSIANNVATGNTLYPLDLDIRRLPVLFANSFTGNGRDTLLVDGHRITFTDTLPHFPGLPWRVTHGPIQIDSGGSLTLAAGDTLAFDPQLGIVVGASGTGALAAPGTAAAPILLTTSFVPSGPNPFGWGGILWRQPSATGNVFTFVTVDRGGFVLRPVCDCSPTPFGALQFADTGAGAATSVNLALDHVIVRSSLGPAVQLRRIGTGTISFTNSQFYANGNYDPMISAFIAQPNQLSITASDLYHYRRAAFSVSGPAGDSVVATGNWWGEILGPDPQYGSTDSLGRAGIVFNAVRYLPFVTTPNFPVGSAAAVVATQDTSLTPALSTSDSIRVRAVDAFGRGVSAVPISWSAPVGTAIAPLTGSGDIGGRLDAQWQFTTSAGTKIATASGVGTPVHFVANVLPGATVAENWTLLPALSQGTVTGQRTITFTSTNRRGVIVTLARDSFGNATQPSPSSICAAAPGQPCPFVFPPYAQIDSTHTSGGSNGDTIFFHANVTTPSPFVLRATYAGPAASLLLDSITITMAPVPGGVRIDRDPNSPGIQTVPDTVMINSLCPTGPGNTSCSVAYTAFVVDSGLTPLPPGNAFFIWHLVPPAGSVTLDSMNAFPHDVVYVTARTNGFVRLAVKDTSGNNFGTDTLPILVQQLPSTVLVTPDTVSVPVGGTTTFHGTVVDAGGDTMTTLPVHWRDDNSFNRHLTIVDTSVANQVTVRLDSTPFGGEYITAFAIGGPGDTAYGSGQVVNPLVLRLGVGLQPWAIAANSQTHAVYVGHQGGQLYQLNGTTDARVDSVSAGKFVSAVAVNSITNRVYAGTDLGVAVFDGTALSLITTVAAGTNQLGVSNLQGLTVDSINNRIYVAVDIGSAAPNPVLRRIDGSTNTFSTANDVPLPGHGTGAAFDPLNGLVYVAIPDSNFVVAVDPVLKTFTRISVGTTPTYVAVNPVTNRVYVANTSSDDITVIDASSGSVLTTITVFYTPGSIAVDAVNNRIYVGTSGVPYLLLINGTNNVYFSTLLVGSPSTDTELGVTFDAGNQKVWTANNSSSSVSRVKY